MMRAFLMTVMAFSLLPDPSVAWAQSRFFRVEDLRPGMKGVGKTVFQGDKPEEFDVEILGVLRGISPGESAVLARFSGGPLERSGVFEGMSGSPVFVDGKLLGAVAFSFPFPKEAVGGITPITQMVDAFAQNADPVVTGPKIILKKSMLWEYRLPLLDPEKRKGDLLSLFQPLAGFGPGRSPFAAHSLVPIATPFSLGGVSPETIEAFAPQLRSLGLSPLQGTGAGFAQSSRSAPTSAPEAPPLEPGANVVVPLIRGDIDASAGGTVTHIDGDRVYAFGHMLFNLGYTELPMHKGRAITVFPSLQSSFKIMETAEPIGTIRQDRSAGIYGLLGRKAKMIPLRVRMTTSRGARKELNYEVGWDRFLTPFLVNFTVFNSIVSTERSLGVSTLRVKGTINITGEEPVEIENRFSSDSNSPVFASLSVALPVNFLLSSGFKNLAFENIDLDITADEEDRAAILDSLRIDRSELKAGESLELDVVYKKSNGEVVMDSYPVKIPDDVTPGPITVLVADGTNLMSMDAREQGEELIPRDLTQLIRFINNIRKNDRLYVRIFRREPGAVIKGEGLPGLPPSILSILKSDRKSGGMSTIQTSTFMEYELPPGEHVVTGSRVLNLVIKP